MKPRRTLLFCFAAIVCTGLSSWFWHHRHVSLEGSFNSEVSSLGARDVESIFLAVAETSEDQSIPFNHYQQATTQGVPLVKEKSTATCAESNCIVVSHYDIPTEGRHQKAWKPQEIRLGDDKGIGYVLTDSVGSHGTYWLASTSGGASVSLEAWVNLETRQSLSRLEHELTILSWGPYKLALKHLNVPVLRVQPQHGAISRQYRMLSNTRAYCGDQTLSPIQTASQEEAAISCATTKGCFAYTMDLENKITYPCSAVYTYHEAAGWLMGQLLEPGSMQPSYEHSLSPYTWHHIAGTYDPSTSLSNVYIDGVLVSTVEVPPSSWEPDAHTNVLVGVHEQAPDIVFPGKIGNARVWSRQLSQLELLHSMSKAVADPPSHKHLLFDLASSQTPSQSPGHAQGDVHSASAQARRSILEQQHETDMAHGEVKVHGVAKPQHMWKAKPGDTTAAKRIMPLQQQRPDHVSCGASSLSAQLHGSGLRFDDSSSVDLMQLQHVIWGVSPSDKTVSAASVLVVVPVEGPFNRETALLQAQYLGAWSGVQSLERLQLVFSLTQPQEVEAIDAVGCVTVSILVPSASEGSINWNAAVMLGLQATSEYPYTMLISQDMMPNRNWLHGLLHALDQDAKVGAAHAKVLRPDGSIAHMGFTIHRAYVPELDKESGTPVEIFEGFPARYQPARQLQSVQGTRCLALLVRSPLLQQVPNLFSEPLGADYSCVDLALRLQEHGWQTVVAPSSMFLMTTVKEQYLDMPELLPPTRFYELWSAKLDAQLAAQLQVHATTTWSMHCGGSMGIEAFNMVQGMEGKLPLRAQIQRGFSWCEHNKVLSGQPAAFRSRIARLRELSSYAPSDIIIYHKDFRHLGKWVWPPRNTSSYLIGRYMFEMDTVHKQWMQQCRDELDEVWSPSTWFADQLAAQGVPRNKVQVMPESLDVNMLDPLIWAPINLPRRRKYAFVSVFKLEDRKGWRELLQAYVQEFSGDDDVSLYIHTTSLDLSYRSDTVMTIFYNYLHDELKVTKKKYPDLDPALPHFEVMGKHMSINEMVRLYRSVDAFVLPSHGEGWGLPYMEAMAMALPVIATNWSGMTEFMNPSVALLLNYSIAPVVSSSDWVHGSNWALPDVPQLQRLMRLLVKNPGKGRLLGARARRHIMTNYDNVAVAKRIVNRIGQIEKLLQARKSGSSEQSADHAAQSGRSLDVPRQFRTVDTFKDPNVQHDLHLCATMGDLRPRAKVPMSLSCTNNEHPTPLKVAMISTYPPRPCGIGTFSRMLIRALLAELPPGSIIEIIPLVKDMEMPGALDVGAATANGNDQETLQVLMPEAEKHKVQFVLTRTVRQGNIGDYVEAARYLKEEGFHTVVLQHEFGIWGGANGAFVVCLANVLQIPVISVIHTLSDNLYNQEHAILQELSYASDRVVVMSNSSRNSLTTYHGVPRSVVSVLPHGVFVEALPSKEERQSLREKLGWSGRLVLMQNGLLHTGKGLDIVAKALPTIVKTHPSVLYVIVGQVHPKCGKHCVNHVKWIKEFIARNKLNKYVVWVEKFVSDADLSSLLHASDVYVMPYRDRITANSGTLSMAMAAGKPVIATPFEHARIAVPGRGVLVPYDDEAALAHAAVQLLADPQRMVAYGQAAYEYMKDKSWSSVARGYVAMFHDMRCATR